MTGLFHLGCFLEIIIVRSSSSLLKDERASVEACAQRSCKTGLGTNGINGAQMQMLNVM